LGQSETKIDGKDTCQESTERGEDPFSLVYFFCCHSGKTNPKMTHYLLYVSLWKLPLPSTTQVFSALSFSSRTERGLGVVGVSIKEKTTHETNKLHWSFCKVP